MSDEPIKAKSVAAERRIHSFYLSRVLAQEAKNDVHYVILSQNASSFLSKEDERISQCGERFTL